MGDFILRKIDNNMRQAFRILCSREGVSMNEKLKELIAKFIRETVEAQKK